MSGFSDKFLPDLRFSLRMLRRGPGLSAVVAVSLAVGIGANTAVFSVAEALMLRPLPYPKPDNIANVWLRTPGLGIEQDWLSPGEFIDLRSQTQCFEDIAISLGDGFNMTGFGRPERIDGMRTSSALFRILGAKTIAGRLFGPAEDKPGGPNSAVITYGIWQRFFAADRSIVGREVVLNGRRFSVVGVLNRDFDLNHEAMPAAGGIERPEIFIPLPLGTEAVSDRSSENYNVLARLASGVTFKQAQAEADVVAARIREKDKRDRSFTIAVEPMSEQLTGKRSGSVGRMVLLLLGAVGLVLLIACVNVANLLLSRAATREREVAIRAAVGASRARLLRQLLTESLALSLTGGAGGVLIAWGLIALVRTIQPGNLPRIGEIGINAAVLAFACGVSAVTGLVFGIVPAIRISGADISGSLRAGGRGLATSAASERVRGALVVAEIVLSLVLLAGGGLLIRSFAEVQRVAPGFDAAHVSTMRVSLRGERYRNASEVIAFFSRLRDRLGSVPEIAAHGAVSALPMSGAAGWAGLDVEESPSTAERPELQADIRSVTPDYFRAMAIKILAGRTFAQHDTAEGPGVVVVDRRMAGHFWPDQSPLGKRVRFSGEARWSQIIGVADSVRQYGLDEDPRMAVYFPVTQVTTPTMFLVARDAGQSDATPAMLRAVRDVDPDLPVYAVAPMTRLVDNSLARRRFAMTTLGGFAFCAVLLAAVGIYGVMSYTVTQSTHDIGVRMALGARPASIAGMVIRRGMGLAGIGIVLGLAGAWAATRTMAGMLYGVAPVDPVTFVAVAAFLALVALVACYIPAARAARLDPVRALRDE